MFTIREPKIIDMKAKTKKINEKEWEKICQRCGQCCHNKIMVKNIVIVNPMKTCEYLKDNRCSIYKDRLRQKNCWHIRQALEKDFMLPNSCPYTKFKPAYKGFDMPDKETFDNWITVFALIEREEKRIGRAMTQKEIKDFQVTEEKLNELYQKK